MTEKTVQEFKKKTGNSLVQEPWQLLKTQAWLDHVCEQNQARIFADPTPLSHIFEPAESLLPLRSIEDVQVDAPEPAPPGPAPRMVKAVRATKKAKVQPGPRVLLKRPASAMSPAAASETQDLAQRRQDENQSASSGSV